jgi:hypothetical protein
MQVAHWSNGQTSKTRATPGKKLGQKPGASTAKAARPPTRPFERLDAWLERTCRRASTTVATSTT